MLKVAFRTQVVGINEAENSGVKVTRKGTQKQTMLHANQFMYVGCLTLSVSTFIIEVRITSGNSTSLGKSDCQSVF